MQQFKTTYIKC